MFGSRRGRTVIGDGLKILGNVTAEGLVEAMVRSVSSDLAGYDCVAHVGHRMSSCSLQSPRICGSLPSSDQIHL
jgi:hypothetical protein